MTRSILAAAIACLVAGCGGSTGGTGDLAGQADGILFDAGGTDPGRDTRDTADLPALQDPGPEDAMSETFPSDEGADPGGEDAGVDADSPDTAMPETGLAKPGYIYAHTASELYSWLPGPAKPKLVAKFGWPNDGLKHEMTDMAIDHDGRLYGLSYDGLYRCDADTADCTNLAAFDQDFNGMTVVPAGTIQPAVETIVAISNNGGWYRVEVQGTQALLTLMGTYGPGYESAGDAYSIEGVGTFAAVNSGFGGTLLVQVDPKNGKVQKEIATIPGDAIYGLAGMGNQVFAFDESGQIFRGDVTSSQFTAYLTTWQAWYGAAVSTRGN
jgi:hypothetical protein